MKYFHKKVFKQVKKNKMQSQKEVFVEFYKVFEILAEIFGDIYWGCPQWLNINSLLQAPSDRVFVENNQAKLQIKLSKQLKVQSDQLSPGSK